jgi:hypothetical protein
MSFLTKNERDIIMKRKVLFLVIPLILVGFLVASCERDPIDPPIVAKYTIEITSGLGGVVSPSGKVEVTKGGGKNVVANSLSGYVIDEVKVDGEVVNISEGLTSYVYPFSEVVSDHTFAATFKKIVIEKVVVKVIPSEGGSLSPSGIKEVAKGSNLNYTLIPLPGYKSASIVVNGVSFPLTSDTYNLLNITADTTEVKGVFKKTLDWYLFCEKGWKQDSIANRRCDGVIWDRYLLWGVPGAHQRILVFLPGNKMSETMDGVTLEGFNDYSIDESKNPPTITIGGFVWNIKVDNTTLVLSRYDADIVCDNIRSKNGGIIETFTRVE